MMEKIPQQHLNVRVLGLSDMLVDQADTYAGQELVDQSQSLVETAQSTFLSSGEDAFQLSLSSFDAPPGGPTFIQPAVLENPQLLQQAIDTTMAAVTAIGPLLTPAGVGLHPLERFSSLDAHESPFPLLDRISTQEYGVDITNMFGAIPYHVAQTVTVDDKPECDHTTIVAKEGKPAKLRRN